MHCLYEQVQARKLFLRNKEVLWVLRALEILKCKVLSTEGDLRALEQKCTKEGGGKILTKGLYQQLKWTIGNKIDSIYQILIVQYFQNKMAQVGSQREDLEPSLKEAGTDVNWEMVGPIIAVVALALIAVIIVIVVCCLKKKYRYYLSNTFWEPGSLLKTSKYHETYPCTISGRYPSKIWWGRWRTKYKEQELKAAIEPHYILKKVQFESWNN